MWAGRNRNDLIPVTPLLRDANHPHYSVVKERANYRPRRALPHPVEASHAMKKHHVQDPPMAGTPKREAGVTW